MTEQIPESFPVTRVGIMGHINLTPDSYPLVRAGIDEVLTGVETPLEGWTSLAAGADQIFAQAVLDAGGTLVFVPPSHDVESTIPAAHVETFRQLRPLTRELPTDIEVASDEAYWAAGKIIGDAVDLLIAVWDGGPSGGLGGTADAVHYRESVGRPWVRVWPEGAARG